MLGPEGDDEDAQVWECREARAKALCATCPVQPECLKFAVDLEPSDGIWGGTTFEERLLICPICGRPKQATALGCSPGHSLMRAAELEALEAEEAWDVKVAGPIGKPSMRTSPYCRRERGADHVTYRAYIQGCRCAPAVAAKLAYTRKARAK
jgi:hypothetical protein